MPNAQGAPTLGDLLDEIEDDIARADLSAQVATAVQRAIRHFETERFFFNERILTFQTLPGVDVYGAGDTAEIPELMAIDSAVLLEGDQVTTLQRIAEAQVEAWDDPASGSRPCAYSYFDRSLRLWPIPSGEWTVRLSAHIRLPPLQDRDATNAWVDEASGLIAARAKWHLALNALRDPAFATMQASIVTDERNALRGRSNVIASSGQVMAYTV
ncbi:MULTISPECIES: hypothetical protein [unclassified Methylobacterium]|uniref:phage adaptor protein n=1 Tax=unclassified Methylobacterium TaxID=2615210 RepID=UPI0006F5A041|nr:MULTISPECIES: hypothetical protein [unclassified Methylobacterium]KQP50834.1 hypothetical protein ASF39_11360 [Methylobacterium sp. Leaf108]KQT88930.1 hypothetical protein ASG59_13750 [Methylobacterium sp. Leaf466]